MAKKAEATLLLKVVTQGKEAIQELGSKFNDFGEKVISAAKGAGLALAAMGSAIVALAVKAGQFETVQASFERLAASQGQKADEILASMKKLTDGMVSEMDLMVAANKATLLGLPMDKFPEMLKIAKSASEATGESMQFMLDSIVTGMGRQSKLILDNLGIMIDVEGAYDRYAATLGRTASQLTETEKKQAFINEALRVGVENADKMQSSGENSSKSWQRFKATLEDTSIAIGKELMPASNKLLEWGIDLLDVTKKLAKDGFLTYILNETAISAALAVRWVKNVLIGYQELYYETKILANKINPFGTQEVYDDAKKSLKDLGDERVKLFESTAEVIGKLHSESVNRMSDEHIHKEGITQKERERLHEEAEKQKAKLELEEKKKVADLLFEEEEKLTKKEEKLLDEKLNKARQASDKFLDHKRKVEEAERREEEAYAREKEKQEQEAAEKLQEQVGMMSGMVVGGFQSATQTAVTMMAETLVPGLGAAAGQMFSMLSQDTDQFIETVNSLFSDKFIDNIAKNIPIFIETMAERLPEFTEKLIEAIIESAPGIIIAWQKALSSPDFNKRMIKAVANGFANGIRDGWDEAWEYIRGRLKIKVDVDGLGGGGGGGGGVGGAVKSVAKKLGFNQGGVVPGIQKFAGGGDVDTVPAMLTPGEFVVNAESSRRNMGLLKSINDGGGGGGSSGNVININVNGGLLGDERQAREFARAIDRELLKLRRDNGSLAFDGSIY